MSFQLNDDQRYLLEFYISQYNETNFLIRNLNSNQEILLDNINNLSRIIYPPSNDYYNINNIIRNRNINTRVSSTHPNPLRNNITTTILPNTNTSNSLSPNISLLLDELFNTFSNPVPVRASNQQIQNATTVTRYSNILNPINNQCPIDLTVFSDNDTVVRINGCGHIFNQTAINTWFNNHVICPVCRYDIRTNNSTSSTPNLSSSYSNISLNSVSFDESKEQETTQPIFNNEYSGNTGSSQEQPEHHIRMIRYNVSPQSLQYLPQILTNTLRRTSGITGSSGTQTTNLTSSSNGTNSQEDICFFNII